MTQPALAPVGFASAAFAASSKVMEIVRCMGADTGSVDARDTQRILVEFPLNGGHPAFIAESACRAFRDNGFDPLTMDVNDQRARFTVSDRATA